jgi:hypothetical protein
MKKQHRTELVQQTWDLLKNFRRNGHPWIQIQKFSIRGVEGIAVVDAFHEVNFPFQRLSREEIEAAIMFKRGLFIAVGLETDPWFRSEPLVTDWVSNQDHLINLRKKLAAYFDLYALLAVQSRYIPRCGGIPELPALLEVTILPGCQRCEWEAEMHMKYSCANTFLFRVGTKLGIYKTLEGLPENYYELLKSNKEMEWHQTDGNAPLQSYERAAVLHYFREVLHDFYVQLAGKDWGRRPRTYIEGYSEIREEMDAIDCGDYAAGIYRAIVKDLHSRQQVVTLPDGSRELARAY